MNLLYELDKNKELATSDQQKLSPLKGWLCNHGAPSLEKFRHLEKNGFKTPLMFEAEIPTRKFVAYIDPDDKFSITDKLSQVKIV